MNQREIKFRVWDKLAKRFYFADSPARQHFIISLDGRFQNLQNGVGGDEVVIQQFTGLRDKNGIDIYEGDIVRCHRLRYPETHRKNFDYNKLPWPEDHWYDCIEIGEIRYSDLSLSFVEDYERLHYDDIWPLQSGVSHRYEVLGNIFENPELLNV